MKEVSDSGVVPIVPPQKVQGRKRNFVPSGCARPRVGGKVRAVTCFGGPPFPRIVCVGTQVVLSGVVPFRIGKARADVTVQALPETT